jgi:hypothetical protein
VVTAWAVAADTTITRSPSGIRPDRCSSAWLTPGGRRVRLRAGIETWTRSSPSAHIPRRAGDRLSRDPNARELGARSARAGPGLSRLGRAASRLAAALRDRRR